MGKTSFMQIEISQGLKQENFPSVQLVPSAEGDTGLLHKAKVARSDERVMTSGWAVTNLLHLEFSMKDQLWEQKLQMGSQFGVTFDPWIQRYWDMHRRINEDFSVFRGDVKVDRFGEFVKSFVGIYGDLFNSIPDTQTLKTWLVELTEISYAVGVLKEVERLQNEANNFYAMTQVQTMAVQVFARRAIEAAVNARDQEAEELRGSLCELDCVDISDAAGLVARKLKKYTALGTVKQLPDSLFSQSPKPNCLAGWLWLLIARDLFNGITYERCTGKGSDQLSCSREIPSVIPAGANSTKCFNCETQN